MSKQSAFTLIELLVVIAIIAMLVSILLPSLRQSREMAKTVMCQSNERAIYGGLSLYAEDWEGMMPRNHNWRDTSLANLGITPDNRPGDHMTTWSQHLTIYPESMLEKHADYPYSASDHWQSPRNYIDNVETYECPTADAVFDVARYATDGWGAQPLWLRTIAGAYGLNNRRSGWAWPELWGPKMHQPAECYLLIDSWHYAFDHVSLADLWYQPRHGPKSHLMNLMFNDGHIELVSEVEILTVEETTTLGNPEYRGHYGVAPPWWGGTAD